MKKIEELLSLELSAKELEACATSYGYIVESNDDGGKEGEEDGNNC